MRVVSALARLLPRSESAATLAESSANKHGLSRALDGTLREGAHDMRVFGLGFLRSLASRQDYATITTGMFHYYRAMEACLDANPHAAGALWRQFPELRRTERLRTDLEDVGVLRPDDDAGAAPVSPATAEYVAAIRKAAREEEGVRLLGHLYVRYFADLFGGRALGWPTQAALRLPSKPHFYTWDAHVEGDRRAYIERLYEALNAAGDGMSGEGQRERVVEEARLAFRHNVAVYTELPSLNYGAAKGAANIVTGGLRSSLGFPPVETAAVKV